MVSVAIRQQHALARAAKVRWKRERIARMLAQIACGCERDTAVAEARALGARLEEIGSALGLTRERVRQICNEENQASHVPERPIRQSARSPQGGQ